MMGRFVSEQLFTYQPLNQALREIRLIKLLPWKQSKQWTTVECEMFESPLSLAPLYECLSYNWGDSPLRKIRIDGKYMEVRQNLFDALTHLRTEESRVLWVDALCIDQSNIPERNNQVQFMRDIYEHAARVLIWLGTLDKNFPRVEGMRFLDWVQRKYEGFHSAVKQPSKMRTLDSLFRESNIEIAVKNNLRLIFMRPWWSRIWIVQEVASAKVAILHLGMSSAAWEALLWITRSLSSNTDNIYELDNQRKARAQGVRESLFDLTYRFRHSKATDSRDKIYALVGLSMAGQEETHGGRKFPIDYNLPLSEVLANLVRHQIEVSLDLSVLWMARGDVAGGPSWSPDPSGWYSGNQFDSLFTIRVLNPFHQPFSASCDSTVMSPFKNASTLSLRGFVLKKFGPHPWYNQVKGDRAVAIKKGDIVCLLAGSKFPAILRKKGEAYTFVRYCTLYRRTGELDEIGCGPYIGTHRIIGDIMSGKLWKDLMNSDRKLEWFNIH